MKTVFLFFTLLVYLPGSMVIANGLLKSNKALNYSNYSQASNIQPNHKSTVRATVPDTPKVQDSVDKFKEELNARIIEFEHEIAALKIEIANGTNATKAEFKKQIADLEQRNLILKNKLENFREKESTKWHAFKKEMNRNADDLGKAIKDLGKKNKQ
jgi:hypothetical protein